MFDDEIKSCAPTARGNSISNGRKCRALFGPATSGAATVRKIKRKKEKRNPIRNVCQRVFKNSARMKRYRLTWRMSYMPVLFKETPVSLAYWRRQRLYCLLPVHPTRAKGYWGRVAPTRSTRTARQSRLLPANSNGPPVSNQSRISIDDAI